MEANQNAPKVDPQEVQQFATKLSEENALLRQQIELMRQQDEERRNQVAVLEAQVSNLKTYIDEKSERVVQDTSEVMAAQLAAQQRAAQQRAANRATSTGAIAQAQMPGQPTQHKVQQGENLSSIALAYHSSLSAVIAANPGIDPHRLRIGQTIRIPGR